MNTFLIIAAVMAAIAASAVAWPLLRERQSRVLGAVAGVVVIGAAAGLYPLWSTWDWHAAAQPQAGAGPDVAAMVAKLEQRLREQPDDANGWLMLGRSYLALERMDDAVQAYDHAHRLDPNNAEAALGLGEAMSMRAGGEITPPAVQLFEDALVLAPTSEKALFYGGFAAAVRGDPAAARERWLALKKLHPPPQIEAMVDARLADLGKLPPAQGAAATPAAPSAASGTPAGTVSTAAEVTVNLKIAPALKSRLTGQAPLFVFAREPGGQGPPLAAKRLTSAALGTQIHLSAADSMIPGRVLVGGQRVSITARVSFSGQPLPAAGDLYGEVAAVVGRDGILELVIDRVAE